jgi:hypothetical protein
MTGDITPLQNLILWALLSHGGSCLQKDLKPEPKPKDRDPLVRAGLISVEKQNRTLVLHVEDKGWRWASENMANEISTRSNAGGLVLHHLLLRLSAFTKARNIALAEILALQPHGAHPGTPDPAEEKNTLREKIRTAFLDLTGGALNMRVRLSDLRQKLADIDRATLDKALLALAAEEGAVLMQFDNRVEITDADRDAALEIGREPRHLLWISK